LSLPHLVQRGVQPQVYFTDLHVQTVEHLTAKYSAGTAFFAQINRFARKIGQACDIRPCQEMELFGEKRGNVDELATDITPCPRLGEVVEQNDGRDRHIGTGECEYVQDVANATVSHHRHHPQRHLAVRAGLLAGGQRGRYFLSYREFSAVRRTADQSGRVLVPRYPRFLPGCALLARIHLCEFSGRNGLSCLRN
jgi:hypothetical protein